MKHKITILTTVLLLAYTSLFSQNLEYFEYEREAQWGISKNSWGGLIGGGILKFSNKVSNNLYRTIGSQRK